MNPRMRTLFPILTMFLCAANSALAEAVSESAIPIIERIQPFELQATITAEEPGRLEIQNLTIKGQFDFDLGLLLHVKSEGKATTRVPVLSPAGTIDLSAFVATDAVGGTRGITVAESSICQATPETIEEGTEVNFHEVLRPTVIIHKNGDLWRYVDQPEFSGWNLESADALPYPIFRALNLASANRERVKTTDGTTTLELPDVKIAFDAETGALIRFEERFPEYSFVLELVSIQQTKPHPASLFEVDFVGQALPSQDSDQILLTND